MKLLNHPNIVKLIDVYEKKEDGTTFLVVEYVAGGELFDYIVANGVVKEKETRQFFRQVVSAVEYCHANLIVHRDLKPENLLLGMCPLFVRARKVLTNRLQMVMETLRYLILD